MAPDADIACRWAAGAASTGAGREKEGVSGAAPEEEASGTAAAEVAEITAGQVQ